MIPLALAHRYRGFSPAPRGRAQPSPVAEVSNQQSVRPSRKTKQLKLPMMKFQPQSYGVGK